MKSGRPGLSIVVVGSSGDLARRKIFPALFALYCQDLLPANFEMYGFARTRMSTEAFRKRIMEHLTCRYVPGEHCAERMSEFLEHCHYMPGPYDSKESYMDLYELMRDRQGAAPTNKVFYLAIPPTVIMDIARGMGAAGLVECTPAPPWTRVVIEKPFGHDRASSDELTRNLAQVFTEDQTYRIDHYLGKEVIQNLMVLRFANVIFEPIWNGTYIDRIHIDWREDMGLEGRAGYFDNYGIVRDVVQNHLLQIAALVAMEPPSSSRAESIRDEKVKVLRAIAALAAKDLALGQYEGYSGEQGVPAGSRTATYAAATLNIDTPRWKNVPFIITAGKGLDSRRTEVRVLFREIPNNIFSDTRADLPENELTIQVQPDPAMYLAITNKEPGLDLSLVRADLDLRYSTEFDRHIPDAYECLLLDVVTGDKSLFIRQDELAAAWDVFTPALHEIEKNRIIPASYPFGSEGPA